MLKSIDDASDACSLHIWTEYMTSVYLTDPTLSSQATFKAFEVLFQQHQKNTANFAKEISFLETEIARLKQDTPKQQDTLRWIFYRMLCAAGALFALCSGFDGMISVLSMFFPQLYVGLIIFFGVISALSGLGIFIARDKPIIALELGINEPTDFSGIEAYLFLLQQYLHLKKEAAVRQARQADEQSTPLNPDVRDQLLEKKVQFKGLKKLFEAVRNLNQEHIESWAVFVKSQLVLLIGAVLFFTDGFFVGEAIGAFLAVILHLDPVFFCFTTALLLASCALAAYCFVERPSLEEYLHGSIFTNQTEFNEKYQQNEADLDLIFMLAP